MFIASLYSSSVHLLSHRHSHPPNNQPPRRGARRPTGKHCSSSVLSCVTNERVQFNFLKDDNEMFLQFVFSVPCVSCRSLSSPWYRRSTQIGVGSCRNKDCTLCGWRGTLPLPTSPSILKTQLTLFCMTCSCSASWTRVWYV